LLDFSPAVEQLILRVQSLKIWNPLENWPDWSIPSLCEKPEEWIAPYLENITRNEDFKKLNLIQILKGSLDYQKQRLMEQLAPASLEVPSGSHINLEYRSEGDIPLLSVRLQELFGLLETPKVNGGKIPVLIELLSPGYKPVQ